MKKKATRLDHVLYVLALFVLIIGTFLILVPLPLLQGFFGLNNFLVYGLMLVASAAVGYIAMTVVDKLEHTEKSEILAGILIPLPAMAMIYLIIQGLLIVQRTVVAVGIIGPYIINLVNPLIAITIIFVGFNLPFFYYYRKKHEVNQLLLYYLLAPVVTAGLIIVIEALLVLS